MIYYVSTSGNDKALGTKDAPFRTINHAAQIARAGDTVRVFGGVYREWVDPKNGGSSPENPIVYEAMEGEHPVIKGSETVEAWERVEGSVWKSVLPNSMFGDFNPYATPLSGDWFCTPTEYQVHLGDVYINGVSMYEASSMEDLYTAERRESGFQCYRKKSFPEEPILNAENTVYRWLAEVDAENTVIYGNFHGYDPNKELIEVNVRKCCFYPTQTGRDYITLRGFEICHAACPFAPPTADQVAMVGCNWSRGWVIENNHLHDAKCSAISIGKEGSTGDNDYTKYHRKHSHYYQTEAVFRGLRAGWCKEKIGSHLIRNNVIHDCGQNAVVGHMGCAFSRIVHNHIYNIATKHEFFGYEIAGIKLHAAIDVVIENNCIHDTTLGVWLDWQTQGMRVTKNLFYDNIRDFMIEVAHGPCTVDDNVMLSAQTIENVAQGTAFIHNILGGNVHHFAILDRQMPYHLPHSTELLGIAPIFGGDDRMFNNLLLCKESGSPINFKPMQLQYETNLAPQDYYPKAMAGGYGHGNPPALPVWVEDNAYAKSCDHLELERGAVTAEGLDARIERKANEWFLVMDVPQAFFDAKCQPVTTERLGAPVYAEAPYDNPDGTPLDLVTDLIGDKRGEILLPGPLAHLKVGKQTIKIWEF